MTGFLVVTILFLTGAVGKGTIRAGWERLHVPVGSWGPWEDAQILTYNVDCKLQGKNPYQAFCTPGDRPYNYPPIWLKLNYLGIHGSSAPMLAWMFMAFTVLVYVFLLRTRTVFSGLCAFFAIVLSNPLFLALERGNSDQLILFLLVFAFFLSSLLPEARGRLLRGASLVLLTALKIYPVAAVISLMKGRRSYWTVLAWGAAALALLLVTAGSDLAEVFRETPTLLYATFGVIPAIYWAGRMVHHDLSLWVVAHRAADFAFASALFAVCAAVGAIIPTRTDFLLPRIRAGQFRDLLAIGCAGIYCFAFAGGASYNYRLIFLIPVFAFFLEAFDSGRKGASIISVVIVAYMAVPFSHGRPREIMDTLLFAVFSAWLGAFVRRELDRDENSDARHDLARA